MSMRVSMVVVVRMAVIMRVSMMIMRMPVMIVSLAAFKVPHSVVQRRKKKVLQEDDYVARMESIIERDFFPDLTDLQARAAYSQAVEDRDVPRIRELYEKMGGGGRVDGSYRSSPATFETPVRHDRSPSGSTSTSITDSERQRQQSVLLQSLDEFLEKHTSEDNESFEEMMDEAKRKHRIKYSWMYDAESTSRLQQEVQLSLPSCERQALDDSKPALVNSWSYTARNSIMYVPDGAPLTDQERARMQLDKEHIQHCRTRFEASPFDESQSREAVRQAARLQTNSRHGQVDVDGKEIKRTGTPAVNGFNLVRTPSPAPGVDSTPLMTWGEIDSTPFRLDAGDATPLPAGVTARAMARVRRRKSAAVDSASWVVTRRRVRGPGATLTSSFAICLFPPFYPRINTFRPARASLVDSLTRTMMNIAQLAGPIIGGALYEAGGFKLPFFIMGCIQTPVSFKSILSIPSVWVPFCTKLGLKPVLIGVYFGLKDGANSLASPIWGFLCDRRGSVKLCLLISTLFGATSIFLLGPFPYMHIDRNLTVVGIALAISGVAFAGQQVAGVVDAMHGAVDAGFPDSASTHSMIAGIWSSFSGAGRFVSRAGTGILVDHIGFQMTAVVIFTVQIIVAVCTVLCSVVSCRRGADGVGGVADGGAPGADVLSTRTTSFTYSVVDIGDYPRMTVTQPESPAESITCKSVSIPLPRNCAIVRRLRAETYAGFPR
nr:EOG090X07SU [Leptodora kindtii]